MSRVNVCSVLVALIAVGSLVLSLSIGIWAAWRIVRSY